MSLKNPKDHNTVVDDPLVLLVPQSIVQWLAPGSHGH